jgi:hypothetical protein
MFLGPCRKRDVQIPMLYSLLAQVNNRASGVTKPSFRDWSLQEDAVAMRWSAEAFGFAVLYLSIQMAKEPYFSGAKALNIDDSL